MSSSRPPCDACQFLQKTCPQDCIYAPHFPPGRPNRFQIVSDVFEENATLRTLRDADLRYRAALVESYLHDATTRHRDPVYGFRGYILLLNERLSELEREIPAARGELSELLDFVTYPYRQRRAHRAQAAASAREQDRLRSLQQVSSPPRGVGGDGGGSSMNLELRLSPYDVNASRVQQPPPQPYHHHQQQPLHPQPEPHQPQSQRRARARMEHPTYSRRRTS